MRVLTYVYILCSFFSNIKILEASNNYNYIARNPRYETLRWDSQPNCIRSHSKLTVPTKTVKRWLSQEPHGTYFLRKNTNSSGFKLVLKNKHQKAFPKGREHDQDNSYKLIVIEVASLEEVYDIIRAGEPIYKRPFSLPVFLEKNLLKVNRKFVEEQLIRLEKGSVILRNIKRNGFNNPEVWMHGIGPSLVYNGNRIIVKAQHKRYTLSSRNFLTINDLANWLLINRGFDKLYLNPDFNFDGIHKNENYDEFGLDRDGYDINGINLGVDRDGYDHNGLNNEGYDRNGYNLQGFDREGFNQQGFDINGYDSSGFDAEGFNSNGFNHLGLSREGLSYIFQGVREDGSFFGLANNGEIIDIPKTYNTFGFDYIGNYKDLPFPVNFNESYNKDGYNYIGYNIWGFEKTQFDQEGFRGLFTKVRDTDEETLLSQFQDTCFNLGDVITMEDRISEFSTLRSTLAFENSLSDMQIKEYLRSGLHFCRTIFSGGMPRLAIKDLKINRENLRIRTSPVPYEKLLKEFKEQHPDFNFKRIIFNTISTDSLIDEVKYPEEGDNESIRSLSVSNQRLIKKSHLAKTLAAYFTKSQIDWVEGQYKLTQIAKVIRDQPRNKQLNILKMFMHGGAHCPDAKKSSVHAAYVGLRLNEATDNIALELTGKSFASQINLALKAKIKIRLRSWIQKQIDTLQREISQENRYRQDNFLEPLAEIDQISTMAGTWDNIATELGLEKYESRFRLTLGVTASDFLNDTTDGLTPKRLLSDLKKSPIYERTINLVFGPLMKLSASTYFDDDKGHPIPVGILQRFGHLVN